MKCLLLTTSIYSDKCFDNLRRLLNSIGSSDDIDIEMHILIQNNPENLSIELPLLLRSIFKLSLYYFHYEKFSFRL